MSRCSVKTISLRRSSDRSSVASVSSSRIVRSSDHLLSVSDVADRARERGQVGEVEQLGVELLDRLRSGGGVDELLLHTLEFLGVELVVVEVLVDLRNVARALRPCHAIAGRRAPAFAARADRFAARASAGSPPGSTPDGAAAPSGRTRPCSAACRRACRLGSCPPSRTSVTSS